MAIGSLGKSQWFRNCKTFFITDINSVMKPSLGFSGMNTGAGIARNGYKHRTRTEKRLWGHYAEVQVQNISGTTQCVT